jgi:ferredoxin--NADP+ reductase
MYKILEKTRLNPVTHKAVIEAPRVARNARPGQFVMIRACESGERIPLTIYSSDPKAGTVAIIFQEAGRTTKLLASLDAGSGILDVAGPLGRPTEVGRAGNIVMIGGGVGIAELVPIARYAKEIGNKLTIIIGARSKDLLILQGDLKALTDKLVIATDDGSLGEKGVVTAPLKALLEKEKFDLAYCVGPDVMMQNVCAVTKEFGLKTIISLDANMVDATGMCGTCRVMVGGRTKFACVDGPEFDGHKVDFKEFMARQKRFKEEERVSLEKCGSKCGCKNK